MARVGRVVKGPSDMRAVLSDRGCTICGLTLWRVSRAIFTWYHCPVCD